MVALLYHSASPGSFSRVLTKLYPQASQFSPETAIYIVRTI